jgi:hypothetical protein
MSRSTDERGQVQPTLVEVGKIFKVDVDYFKKHFIDSNNTIQRWKVAADGSISNALFSS